MTGTHHVTPPHAFDGRVHVSSPSDPKILIPRLYDGLQCNLQTTPTEMLAPVYLFHPPSKRVPHRRLCV